MKRKVKTCATTTTKTKVAKLSAKLKTIGTLDIIFFQGGH